MQTTARKPSKARPEAKAQDASEGKETVGDSTANRESTESSTLGTLAQRIHMKRLDMGQSLLDLTNELGVSYSYLVTVLANESRMRSISRDFIERIAKYLNVSIAQIYVWAGVLTAADFSTPDVLEGDLERAFRAMQADPNDLLCPTFSEWQSLSQEMRVFIVGLYEWASGSNYLTPLRVPDLPESPAPSDQ